MAILSQMPVWFVFAVVFIFIVAIVASFALGFVVKQKPMKFTLWGAGAVLTVLAVACFLVGGESGDEEKEVAAIEAEQKTKKPADDGSKVKIVIDEGTLHDSGGYDPLKGEALELEKMESAPKESAAKRNERMELGRRLSRIEHDMMSEVSNLGAGVQGIDELLREQKITNYEAIHQKSISNAKQYKAIINGMDAKLRALKGIKHLTESDVAGDRQKIEKRRDEAQKKYDEYQGVLDELSANVEVFKDL